MPERIKRLRKHRGEAVMAVQVVHLAKTKVPKSSIILMRDSDGKEERLKAWMAFRQTNKSVIVGMAKKSVEAWVLACWDSDKEQIRDASTWIKQERGSEFDPFREPERLAPNLSKRLLEHYNCTCSDDYADVLTRATDAHIRSDAAKRAGLSQFVEQIEAKLAHIIDIETKQVSDAN